MRTANGWLSRTGLLAAMGLIALGCGHQTYELRLLETQKYFAYVQKLDANLAPPWKMLPVEELRVPLQFREIRKPPMVKTADGQFVEPEIDPRQPDYLALKYPGLLGAWEAPLTVVMDGQTKSVKGYLYCVTNGMLLLKPDDAQRAPDFMRDLLVLLAEKLMVPQLDYSSAGERVTIPKTMSYTPQNNFRLFKFQGDSLRIDGVPYTIEVYEHQQGPVQVALILVTPVGMDSSAQLSSVRVPLMLERLKVSPKPPIGTGVRPSPTTGGGVVPSPGGAAPPTSSF
jgi:hypothetical protein